MLVQASLLSVLLLSELGKTMYKRLCRSMSQGRSFIEVPMIQLGQDLFFVVLSILGESSFFVVLVAIVWLSNSEGCDVAGMGEISPTIAF